MLIYAINHSSIFLIYIYIYIFSSVICTVDISLFNKVLHYVTEFIIIIIKQNFVINQFLIYHFE